MDKIRDTLNEGQSLLASAQRIIKKLTAVYGVPKPEPEPDDYLSLRNSTGGEFGQLFDKLDTERFLRRCKMSRKCFDFVVDGMVRSGRLTPSADITAQEKLYIAMQRLSGQTFGDLSDFMILDETTITNICKNVFDCIWKEFQPMFLPPANDFTWESVMHEYYTAFGLPNCMGAIGLEHFRIRRPADCGNAFFNYKYFDSISLQAVARPNCQFVAINAGYPGSIHPGGVFHESSLLSHLEAGQSTRECLLPQSDIMFPMYLVGNESYPLDRYLITPYSQHNITAADGAFNKILRGAHVSINRAFKFLRQKFPIFDRTIDMNLQDLVTMISSCCVLQNIIIDIDGSEYTPPFNRTFDDRNDYSIPNLPNLQSGATVRKVLQEYLKARDGTTDTTPQAKHNLPGKHFPTAEISSDCFLPLASTDSTAPEPTVDTGGVTIPASPSEETQFPSFIEK